MKIRLFVFGFLAISTLSGCFGEGNHESITSASTSLRGQAATGASLPDAAIEYGLYNVVTKTGTTLGTTKTDANGNFLFDFNQIIPADHILYLSVLDPVDNQPVVQSVVFPEDAAKHINVTPHSHLVANLTFTSSASTIEDLKSDYNTAVGNTLELLSPIAKNANIAELDKEKLLFEPFDVESSGIDELVESLSVNCEKTDSTSTGDCRIKFNSKNIHAAVIGKKNTNQSDSQEQNNEEETGMQISMDNAANSLESIVSAIQQLDDNSTELFKPVGPVLLVFDHTTKWGSPGDPSAGYVGQLKIINMTDAPIGLGDYSIKLLSNTLNAWGMWGADATVYPIENDPDKKLFHFTFSEWTLLRPNQHHIIGMNGTGTPESVNDLHGCVISDGVDEKKCVVKVGEQAALEYISNVSFGDGGVSDDKDNPLEKAIKANTSSDARDKDAIAATGGADQPPSQASPSLTTERFPVELEITGAWETGFNGAIRFDAPVTGNGWTLSFAKPSGIDTIDLWSNEGGINDNNKIDITNPSWNDKLSINQPVMINFGVVGNNNYGSVTDTNDCQLVNAGKSYPCKLNLDESIIDEVTQSETTIQISSSETNPIMISSVPFTPASTPLTTAIHQAVKNGRGTTQAKTPTTLEFESPSNFNNKIIAGYISEWSVYGRKFNVERLFKNDGTFPYNKLVVAFLGICGDQGKLKGTIDAECQSQGKAKHEVVFLDPWALFGTTNSDRQKKIKWKDGKEKGLMEQLRYLKENVSDLKISASIGGWTMSEPFHRLAAEQDSIDIFVASLNTLQQEMNSNYGFTFDGFDIDWEFPGHGGESKKFTSNDGEYFKNLVCAVKAGLNNNEEISSAVGATYNFIEKIGSHYKDIYDANCLDYLYMMNYDFFGGWDTKVGHQTSLLPSDSFVGSAPTDGTTDKRWSIDAAIRAFEEYGFMRDRLIMGVANYARGFKSGNLAIDDGNGAVNGMKTNAEPPVGTYEKGVMEGYDLWQQIATSENRLSSTLNLHGRGDFKLLTDFDAQADAYYNPVTHDYFSIDTPRTAYLKAKLSDKLGLAGTFVWTVEQDDGKIVTAMQDGFGLNGAIPSDREGLYTSCGLPFSDRIGVSTEIFDLNPSSTIPNPCETLYENINSAPADNTSSVSTLIKNALIVTKDGLDMPLVYPSGNKLLLGSFLASESEAETESSSLTPVAPPPTDTSLINNNFVLNNSLVDEDKNAAIGAQGQKIKDAVAMVRTIDNTTVENVAAGNPANPENIKRVEGIINQTRWDYLFSQANEKYTYNKFLQAIAKYPAFCQSYTSDNKAVYNELASGNAAVNDEAVSTDVCKRSLVAMFAHFAQETGANTPSLRDANGDLIPVWRQALYFVREMGWTETAKDGYNGNCAPSAGNWAADSFPCGKFEDGDYKSYFGRGAKQLSYNYNYGPFSQSIYGDVSVLLNEPERVADTWLNIASALFFYVTPQPPKPSMLSVIDGSWTPNMDDTNRNLTAGFGATINIINGGLECTNPATEDARAQNRINYYLEFANELGLTVDANDPTLSCVGMDRFNELGGGALPIYWDKDWNYDNSRGGPSYRCKLVSYQTPYSALIGSGYKECVEGHFPNAL